MKQVTKYILTAHNLDTGDKLCFGTHERFEAFDLSKCRLFDSIESANFKAMIISKADNLHLHAEPVMLYARSTQERLIYVSYSNHLTRSTHIVIVSIDQKYETIREYLNAATQKISNELGVAADQIEIVDYKFFGTDITFI